MKSALGASVKHLMLSLLVAAMAAALVFGLWYPPPYGALAGGFTLFTLVVSVDVICGPLLTLVVFDPRKPHRELLRDIGLVVLLQLSALTYGLYSVAQARPIYLAYEGNRFRVVSMADVDASKLPNALPQFRAPGYTGPRLVGAKLAEETDPNYKESIILSMQGLPPAFRPDRWVPYDSLLPQLKAELAPIATLKAKHPEAVAEIDAAMTQHRLTDETAGYLPLDAAKADPLNWVVIVARGTGQPMAFLPLDGW